MIYLLLVEHQQLVKLFIQQDLSVALLPDPTASLVFYRTSGSTAHIALLWQIQTSRRKLSSQLRNSFSTVFGSAPATASTHTLTPSA